MPKWLDGLLARLSPDERLLALEREAQDLRLELEERDRLVSNLREELERQRGGTSIRVTESVQAQIEQLLSEAAAPAAQLLTQAHLLEVDGRPVQARDILTVAKRLVRTLEDHGLTPEGSVGQTVPFDPDRHEPLSADAYPDPGQPVVVRFVGVAYRGKLLRKAGIEQ
jgi:molecular chaperone GrpE (heat shock protein)